YQELSQLKTKEELIAFEEELKDRFGALPKEAQELLESVELKWIATTLGIERIILKKGNCLCYFIADQQSNFYQSERFGSIIGHIQKNADQMVLKEKNTSNGPKLLLSIKDIEEVKKLKETLKSLLQ
ncbi:MAG: TRCF domain-containing protein, partial [Flavobacteriaceae bacterium]